MDEPDTRKEVASAEDRADPGEAGAWFFVRGADAIRMVRRYLRGATIRDWLWIALAGIALWRFWFVPDRLSEIAQILRVR